jgi:aspartate aminotransferase
LNSFCTFFSHYFDGPSDERVGNLTVVLKDASMAANTKSQFSILVRGNYSNPPAHGARMVKKILSDPSLYALW